MRFLLVTTCLIALLPGVARAGCSVLSLEGQTLTVEEFEPGSWQAAVDAASTVFKRAKTAGELFDRIYLGGYKVQEVRQHVEQHEAEWNEALMAAQEAMFPFEGTCAGELLADVVRKATKFREPELNMVTGMLSGKPLQASQKNLHDGREQDYLQYERRFLTILEGAQVTTIGSSAPPEASPTE